LIICNGTMYLNTRRKIEFVLLFFIVLFAFAAASVGYWIQWAFLASILVFLIIVDYLFLDESAFIFDPNRDSWAQKSGTANAQ